MKEHAEAIHPAQPERARMGEELRLGRHIDDVANDGAARQPIERGVEMFVLVEGSYRASGWFTGDEAVRSVALPTLYLVASALFAS